MILLLKIPIKIIILFAVCKGQLKKVKQLIKHIIMGMKIRMINVYDQKATIIYSDDRDLLIRNLLEVNREQRLDLDRKIGEIDILKSNVEILREDNEAKEAEIVSLRQEVSTYRTQAIETNRENIRLKAALERQDKIVESLEERNNGLSSQLAGLHTLNNAVI